MSSLEENENNKLSLQRSQYSLEESLNRLDWSKDQIWEEESPIDENKTNEEQSDSINIPWTLVAVHSGEWDNSSRIKSGSVRRSVNKSIFSISIDFLMIESKKKNSIKRNRLMITNDFAKFLRRCSVSTSWLIILSHIESSHCKHVSTNDIYE